MVVSHLPWSLEVKFGSSGGTVGVLTLSHLSSPWETAFKEKSHRFTLKKILIGIDRNERIKRNYQNQNRKIIRKEKRCIRV